MAIVVSPGDTLSSISNSLGIEPEELVRANPSTDFNQLLSGELLINPNQKFDLIKDAWSLGYRDIADLSDRSGLDVAQVKAFVDTLGEGEGPSKNIITEDMLLKAGDVAEKGIRIAGTQIKNATLAGARAIDNFDAAPMLDAAEVFSKDVIADIKNIASEFVADIPAKKPTQKPRTKTTKEQTSSIFSQDILDEIAQIAEQEVSESGDKTAFLAGELAKGLTFGAADELAALISDEPYDVARARQKVRRERFVRENPSVADLAAPIEFIGALPTGIGLAGGLAKAGITSIAKQGLIEGALYGGLSNDSIEDRVQGAAFGGLTGLALGKVVDLAVTGVANRGLRSEADDIADDAIDIDPVVRNKENDEILANEVFEEVDNPIYATQSLSEAKTAGEFYEGVKGAVRRFYNDKVKGISDSLWSGVSAQVGARVQRADQAALVTTSKELDALSERLIPVLQIINNSQHVKGTLLDYGKGSLGRTREEALSNLRRELSDDLNSEHMSILEEYLDYSYRKNNDLNAFVFGAVFDKNKTYLHTRLSKKDRSRIKEEQNLSDAELDKLLDDPAFSYRTRGDYLNPRDRARPDPNDYDNPIISDMQRLFKMERFNQIQRVFGVDIDEMIKVKKSYAKPGELVYITPDEFMDEFAYTLMKKKISREGALYTRQKVLDLIYGQDNTPHPVIQALSSLSYATTLAGPMSAILNVADIPLVGAKYGRQAVIEGMKAVAPRPFKTVPNKDLQKLGISSQTFGEFVNKSNDMLQNTNGFLVNMASQMRRGADFLMKGSLFAAMDQVGKQGVMRGVLRSASDDANAGKLADNWSFYFNDRELDVLTKQFLNHGDDWRKYTGEGKQLAEELMLAGLGQQQLISAAGRPAAWARHPNLRPLWALRGFVIKQQALAMREVMDNIKAGKPEEAAKFLGRYAAYGAGGYAVINEGRQFIFGDGEATFNGLLRGYGDAWASLLTANTLGLNDYQFGQIKQNGILPTLAQGLMPIAITRPYDIVTTAADVADTARPPQALVTEALPIVKQTARFARNISPEGSEAESMFKEVLRMRNED